MRNAKALKELVLKQKEDDVTTTDRRFFKEKEDDLKMEEYRVNDEQKNYLHEQV